MHSTYDSAGRLETLTYPDTGTGKPRLVTRNVYDGVGNGYLTRVENAVSGLKYWELLDMDAEGRVTQERLGNNVHTARVFDARGRLTELDATIGTNGAQRQLLSYVYDSLGNLEERRDLFPATAIRENFSYDALNRLTAVSQNGISTATFAYDYNGNIKAKSDFGDDYRYGENGAGPHAMTSVRKAGALIASFAYDANGRLTSGNGRVVSYTSFGMPRTITRGGSTATFKYNTDHMRMVQTTGTGKITYLDPNEKTGGYLYEKETKSGKTIHRHFIAGGVAVLEYEAGSSVIERTRYFLKDHLGSTDTVLDELGNIVERLSFDAFGMRRDAGSWTVTGAAILPLSTNRGYTGHEHLDGVGLIHMNGRIYDPQAGRFLTADPLIQAPRNSQSLNRYSYVVNNPLTLTDPSGYSWAKVRDKYVKPLAIAALAFYAGGLAYSAALTSGISGAATVALANLGSAVAAAQVGAAAAYGAVTGGILGGYSGYSSSGGSARGTINGAIKGTVKGGLSGGISGELAQAGGLGRMVGSGINGYLQTGTGKGFARGFVAGGIPMDLGISKVSGHFPTSLSRGGNTDPIAAD